MLSVKCLQFVSFLVTIIVLIGKGQVPTDGSHKETAQTQVFSFLVSISVSVAKGNVQRASLSLGERTHIGYVSFRVWFRVSVVRGKVPTAGFSQEGHTNTLEWICGLGIVCFGQSGV